MSTDNVGASSDEWFPNPLDTMPLAKESPSWEDTAPSEYEPPDEDWFNESEEIEEEKKTMHQKMYEMATKKHSPWRGGGSENFQGGSENLTRS